MNDNQYEIIDLPKYAYPDLTNEEGCWAASMPDKAIKEQDVIFFYTDSFGDLHYGVNAKYEGILLSGVNVRMNQQTQPLWAIIDVYGNTLSIELSNALRTLESGLNRHAVTANQNYSQVGQSLNSIGYYLIKINKLRR